MRRPALLLVLLAALGSVNGGRVKQALFGSFFGEPRKHTHADSAMADAEQAELVDFLRMNGFGKYAGKDFIAKLDDELAYDSIEDMTHLVADDDYTEIDMPREDAMQIQKLARREMLKRFLASVPLPSGASADLFSQHLEALITAGYDEPDDVADLEEDEAERMGISLEHVKILVAYADEVRAQPAYKANSAVFRIFRACCYADAPSRTVACSQYETRLLLHVILTTHTDDNGGMPYSSESAWRPIVDALVKSGVRSLADVAQLTTTDVPSVHKDDLKALQNDPRVLRHTQKQEL